MTTFPPVAAHDGAYSFSVQENIVGPNDDDDEDDDDDDDAVFAVSEEP